MIKTMRVVAANKPVGTITVIWNEDPEFEWNYVVPIEDGVPYSGEDLKRWLIAESYDAIEEILERRSANFDGLEYESKLSTDVSSLSKEYEEFVGMEGTQ